MEPAASVIEFLGGAQAVASIIGKHYSRVYRWTYPESTREGTGGLIPSRDQRSLLQYAQNHDVDLRPEDFFTSHRLQVLLASRAERENA